MSASPSSSGSSSPTSSSPKSPSSLLQRAFSMISQPTLERTESSTSRAAAGLHERAYSVPSSPNNSSAPVAHAYRDRSNSVPTLELPELEEGDVRKKYVNRRASVDSKAVLKAMDYIMY
mmetsp:Transcript_4315/g.6640  ORF Transcript_4315/g.6640 Transcript_4315/m.6640 type:complete len:119 (+) Transcript_4315:89-445(+)|eukprot:CAMPEP_0184659230 /NCGR_PEP_ID=MMETSP0308-20130426/28908_1 /TAXON_ID=38269 /ORGANISM="Gloeochaete witrockiana, Strain SAG 46.84" /LENGTH=118 /DNA_ID=CAMNT_0027098909 /DNA_START=12 /DNA_END=368 /DNA_ORIENTATION=-